MAERHPRISVVVAARNIPETLRDSLTALGAQEGIEEAEVIVADGSGGGAEFIPRDFAWVRHLRLQPAAVPLLKGAAIQASAGEIVAVLDPLDTPEPGWLREILATFEGEAVAAGGAVVPGEGGGVTDLAAYLFEYGAFAPPLREGPTDGDLPGNNVAYRRSALLDWCGDLLPGGFWKPFFHQRIRARDGVFLLRPGMRVRHQTRYRLPRFCLRCFHYGRCFGAMRLRHVARPRRVLYRALCPSIPLLLSARHVARAVRHPVHRHLLPRAALPLLAICASWGLGECIGYWVGHGRSCDKVH